jgi:actin beta/gamma 1
MANENPSFVVIDSGSGFCKAGFSGDDVPSTVFPTVVGCQKSEADSNRDQFVGYQCKDIQPDELSYPVKRGVVTNWDDMELIWRHCFQEIKAEPIEHPVLLCEPPLCPKSNRQKMIEVKIDSKHCCLTTFLS